MSNASVRNSWEHVDERYDTVYSNLESGTVSQLSVHETDAVDGAVDSRVVADAEGSARFVGLVPCLCLLDAATVVIDVIYHANGQTYGALPNQLEFARQVKSCAANNDCRIDEECVDGVCQLFNCSAAGTCRGCLSSFGRDAMRRAAIVQQQP